MANVIRELVLAQPATRSSRGRNGTFTARRLQVYARTGNTPEDRGFVSIDAWSLRDAKQAPLGLGLSLEDAVVLADEILAAVRAVVPFNHCGTCGAEVNAHTGLCPRYCNADRAGAVGP